MVGTFHLLAGVIVVGGLAKVAAPDAFARLARSPRPVARLVGLGEVALGGAAILVGGPLAAAAVAFAYAAFTVVIVVAKRAGSPSCGCFGAVAAPPHPLHIVLNALSCVIAIAIALSGGVPALSATLAAQPIAGIPYVAAVATGTWLVVTLSTTGAALATEMASVASLGPTFQGRQP